MITIHVVVVVVVALGCLCLGLAWGHAALAYSLTRGSKDPDTRDAKNIGGSFWFVVPEHEYVSEILPKMRRSRYHPPYEPRGDDDDVR